MNRIYYDNSQETIDWTQHIDGNEGPSSCEECGSPDIQYHCTIDDEPYLICNECKHIFEASLR